MFEIKRLPTAFLLSLILSLAWYSYQSRFLLNVIDLLIGLMAVVSLFVLVRAFRLRGEERRFRKGDSPSYRIRACLTAANLLVLSIALFFANYLSILTIQSTAGAYWFEMGLRFVSIFLVGAALYFVRHRSFLVALHVPAFAAAAGLIFEIGRAFYQPSADESVVLQPLTDEPFIVFNGGLSRLNNTMVARKTPIYLGCFMTTSDRFGQPGKLEPSDRFKFSLGKSVYSPVAGVVRSLHDGIPDHDFEQPDLKTPLGNYLTLETEEGYFVFIQNLKSGQFRVKKNDRVVPGQLLGEIGMSAKITECMLLVCVMDQPDLFNPSAKSIPFSFVGVEKQGDPSQEGPFFPVRNDIFIPTAFHQ